MSTPDHEKESPAPESFEDALSQLRKIVDQLERGEFSLEESVNAFERGAGLLRFCSDALSSAEGRVKLLIEKEGAKLVVGFLDDEDDE